MLNEVFLLQERKGGREGGDRQRETGREDRKNVESHRPLCTVLFENIRLNSASISSPVSALSYILILLPLPPPSLGKHALRGCS